MTTFIRINFQQEPDKKKFIDLLNNKEAEFYIRFEYAKGKPVLKSQLESAKDLMVEDSDEEGDSKRLSNVKDRILFNKSKMLTYNQSRNSLRMEYPVIDREAKQLHDKSFWLEIVTGAGTTVYLKNVKSEAGNTRQAEAIFTYCEDKDQDVFNELYATVYEKRTDKAHGTHGTFFEVKLDQEAKKDDDSFTIKSGCSPCNIL